MKTMLGHGLAIVLLLGVAGCANNSSARSTTQPAMMTINQYCAVNPNDPVNPSLTVMYQGKLIGFCCPDCIEALNKDASVRSQALKRISTENQ